MVRKRLCASRLAKFELETSMQYLRSSARVCAGDLGLGLGFRVDGGRRRGQGGGRDMLWGVEEEVPSLLRLSGVAP